MPEQNQVDQAALPYEISLEGHVTARPVLQNGSVARFL